MTYTSDADGANMEALIKALVDKAIELELSGRNSDSGKEIIQDIKDLVYDHKELIYDHKDEIIDMVVDRTVAETVRECMPMLAKKLMEGEA